MHLADVGFRVTSRHSSGNKFSIFDGSFRPKALIGLVELSGRGLIKTAFQPSISSGLSVCFLVKLKRTLTSLVHQPVPTDVCLETLGGFLVPETEVRPGIDVLSVLPLGVRADVGL